MTKNFIGRFTFSDSMTYAEGAQARRSNERSNLSIVSLTHTSAFFVFSSIGDVTSICPNWSAESEIRNRLFYPFVRTALKHVSRDCSKRLVELERSAREKGFKAIDEYHRDLSNDPALRTEIHAGFCCDFEGVDFYLPKEKTKGATTFSSHFAKLWIEPYPFTL
jgi:hypothetical protein